MEVYIAVFELIKFSLNRDDLDSTEARGHYDMFIKETQEAFNKYYCSIFLGCKERRLQYVVERHRIVVWASCGTEKGWLSLLNFCKSVMLHAFANSLPIRAFIDTFCVDGKTWVDPSFFYERYNVDFSPEVSKAINRLAEMRWCGIHLSDDAVRSVKSFHSSKDAKEINGMLLPYFFKPIGREVVTIKWISRYYSRFFDYQLEQLSNENDIEEVCKKLITNTKDFAEFAFATTY